MSLLNYFSIALQIALRDALYSFGTAEAQSPPSWCSWTFWPLPGGSNHGRLVRWLLALRRLLWVVHLRQLGLKEECFWWKCPMPPSDYPVLRRSWIQVISCRVLFRRSPYGKCTANSLAFAGVCRNWSCFCPYLGNLFHCLFRHRRRLRWVPSSRRHRGSWCSSWHGPRWISATVSQPGISWWVWWSLWRPNCWLHFLWRTCASRSPVRVAGSPLRCWACRREETVTEDVCWLLPSKDSSGDEAFQGCCTYFRRFWEGNAKINIS